MENFSTIGIFSKEKDERLKATLTALHDFLLEKGYKVLVLKTQLNISM